MDCAVQGPGFFAGATPQLDNLLYEVTKKVKEKEEQTEVSLFAFFRFELLLIPDFESCKLTAIKLI